MQFGSAKNVHSGEPDTDIGSGANSPMPYEEFLTGNHLHRGDVLLISEIDSFKSTLIRFAIRSTFSHAALVFLVPSPHMGFDQNYLIESSTGGVDITALRDYVDPRNGRKIVGVKRYEAEWFDPRLRSLVSGRMLRFIKEDYAFLKASTLGISALRLVYKIRNLFMARPPSIKRYVKYIHKRVQAGKYVPAEFICSGFVQYAYVDAVRKMLEIQCQIKEEAGEETIDCEEYKAFENKLINEVLFADWLDDESSMESLLAVSPADLAASSKLQWKYIIFDGMAYRVNSQAQADAKLKELV